MIFYFSPNFPVVWDTEDYFYLVFQWYSLYFIDMQFDIQFNFFLICTTLFILKNGLTINMKEFGEYQEAKYGRVGRALKEIYWRITKEQCSNSCYKIKTFFFWGKDSNFKMSSVALAGWLIWLACHPNRSKLWVQSLVRAHTRNNQLMHK